MAAQRKPQAAVASPDAAARPRPVAAAPGMAARAGGASSPVHLQIKALEATLAEAPPLPRYPLALRLAILGGAPLALWAAVILGVAGVVRLLHA